MWTFLNAIGILLLNSLVFGNIEAKHSYFQAAVSQHGNMGNEEILNDKVIGNFWTNHFILGNNSKNSTVLKKFQGVHRVKRSSLTRGSSGITHDEVQELLLLLEERGDKVVELRKETKDLILVIGNTGAGKTTMTLALTANLSALVAEKVDGSGFRIIHTASKRIHNIVTVSKTTVPDRIVDQETGLVFYDCPGFLDTRSSPVEISNSFFIKKVADFAERVKILMVVNHFSVSFAGGDRADLSKLLRSTVNLLKNVDTFLGSVGLIVTKVASSDSDQEIQGSIIRFLEEAKEHLPSNNWIGKDLESARKLIDALTGKGIRGMETRVKIGFFRQPTRPGPLSEHEPAVKFRETIKSQLLGQNMSWANTHHSDFGHSISLKSQKSMEKALNAKLSMLFCQLSKNISSLFDQQIKSLNSLDDFTQLQQQVQNFVIGVRLSKSKGSTNLQIQELENIINATAAAKKYNLLQMNAIFKSLNSHIAFLELLKEPNSNTNNQEESQLGELWKKLQTVCNNLEKYFKEPEFSNDAPSKTAIFKGHFIQLSEAKKSIPQGSETVLFLAVNSIIVDDDLDGKTLGGGENLRVVIIAPRWIISGNRNFNLDGAEGASFPKMMTPGRNGQPGNPGGNGGHFLGIGEIFVGAGNVQVSTDGGKGGPGQDGGDGAAGKTAEKIDINRIGTTYTGGWFSKKTWSLTGPYESEANGRCEKPLGTTCLSFDVSSRDPIPAGKSGGDGGVGGFGGAAGSITIINFSQESILQQSTRQNSTNQGLLHYKSYRAPKNGDEGESGKGGQGGAGGRKADTLTVDVDFCNCEDDDLTFEFTCDTLTGSFSKFVTGYRYGERPPNGQDIIITEKDSEFCDDHYETIIGGVKWTASYVPRYIDLWFGRLPAFQAAKGVKGIDGKNTEDQQQRHPVAPLNKPQPLILFKQLTVDYLIKNDEIIQKDFPFYSKTLTSFVTIMEADENVTNLYDVVSLMQEFKDLEVLHATNSLRVTQWLSFYQPLLNRIIAMSSIRPQAEEKKALVYLYTAVLSRINTLLLMTKPTDESDSGHLLDFQQPQNLVINLLGFLTDAIAELGAVENLEKSAKHDEVVRTSERNYEKEIMDKAMEAYNLIQDIVKPEFQLIFTQIDQEVDNLLNEILELRRATQIENEELTKKEQKLQENMQLRTIFSVLKGTAGVVSFFGPYGAAIGGVVGSVSSITESFVLDNPTVTGKPVQLPPSVSGALNLVNKEFTDQKNRQCADLAKQLEAISQELGNSKEFKPSQEKVTEIREKIKVESEKTFAAGDLIAVLKSKEKLNSFKAEIKTTLADNEKALRNQKDVIGRNAESRQAILTKITHVQQIVSISADIYSKYHLDQARLDQLSEQLKASKVKIQATEAAEMRLNEKLMPMVKNLQLDLGGIQRGLTNQSAVSLDISKWRVGSTLRDLRLTLKREFTKGSTVEDTMNRAFERLEETMEILITVYGRLQTFSEQSKLARFIAAVNRPTYSTTVENFEDEKLRTAVQSLELVVKYNRVLQCSAKAFETFKMWTFPFAHDHLELDPLSTTLFNNTELQTTANFKNLVDEARRRLTQLKSIASEDETTVNNRRDSAVQEDTFTRKARSPFYIWNSSKYNETIQQLLAGKEILLMAHVEKSPRDLDSIKFKNVHIQLTITKPKKSQASSLSPSSSSNESNDDVNNSEEEEKIENAQAKLNKILDANFELVLTHLGNSHYRIDGQYYLIPSTSLTMKPTFKKNNQGLPRGQNRVYQKIMSGDIILSPYALWKMKLVRLENQNGPQRKSGSGRRSRSRRDLAEEEAQVLDGPSSADMMPELKEMAIDLDLVGEGSFIRKGSIKDLNVGHFYHRVNLDLDLEQSSKSHGPCE